MLHHLMNKLATLQLFSFWRGEFSRNQRNIEEYESIPASIDKLSTDDDIYDISISTNYLEDIPDGSQINPEINARYSRFKIRDHIRKM